MKILAYILLLQMIDARNFAKAKRNIFKIQLKREPRRKRKTVSCGLKINLPILTTRKQEIISIFVSGSKVLIPDFHLPSQIIFTFKENEKTEWGMAKFNMCCR